MKRLHIMLSAAVVLAISSAFTTAHIENAPKKDKNGFATYLFYRKTTAPVHSTNASDYVYRPSGGCSSNPGTYCNANFTQDNAPTTPGESPTGTFASVGTNNGIWNGN